MNMEKVRDKADAFHGFKSSQLEEGKAFTIVKITVHMTTEEIILIINEVEGYPIQDRFLNTTVLSTPSYTNFKVENILNLVSKLCFYHIIIR